MLDEIVHIKNRPSIMSYCGVNLNLCKVIRTLFVERYKPDRNLFCVYTTVHEDTAYPIIELVSVVEELDVCDDCLSGFGMELLNIVQSKQHSLDFVL